MEETRRVWNGGDASENEESIEFELEEEDEFTPEERYFRTVCASFLPEHLGRVSVQGLHNANVQQGGLCAVTNFPMVIKLTEDGGLTWYSAVPHKSKRTKGPMTDGNVRLVCNFVRQLQGSMNDDELLTFTTIVSRMRAKQH